MGFKFFKRVSCAGKIRSLILIACIFINNAWAVSPKDDEVENYFKIQKEFRNSLCPNGTEDSYRKLQQVYRGEGHYIPSMIDNRIDLATIRNNMPLLQEKLNWVSSLEIKIQQKKNWQVERNLILKLKDRLSNFQELSKQHFLFHTAWGKWKKKKRKGNAIASAREVKEMELDMQFQKIKVDVNSLVNHFDFLLPFKFPVDFLKLRGDYDEVKKSKNNSIKMKANQIYFYRKVVEDGTSDEKGMQNDANLRAVFSQLYLSLNRENIDQRWFSESERVDLLYILETFEHLLSYSTIHMALRLNLWKQRIQKSIEFYQKILNSNPQDLNNDRSQSLIAIKDFVLKKESDVYHFWSKQSSMMQALYVMDTILYSEVGDFDVRGELERRTVANVVYNRFINGDYNTITEDDSIFKYLKIKTENNKWLNVLFKEGEFSFTYFYIGGNTSIYCPDMSRRGVFLRRQNTHLAYEILKSHLAAIRQVSSSPPSPSSLIRYYSRVSMFGRIEMDTLWNQYKYEPQLVGLPSQNISKLMKKIEYGDFKFLYAIDRQLSVIEVSDRPYVIDLNKYKTIYDYRNPDWFKYFISLKK